MKVVYIFDHAPMFEMNFDERGIFISSLQQSFCERFPQDENAKRMLHTAEQIDLAVRAMANITNHA